MTGPLDEEHVELVLGVVSVETAPPDDIQVRCGRGLGR